MTTSWRKNAWWFAEIGKQLATIENGLRSVAATSVVSDSQAKAFVSEMRSASNKLVRALNVISTE